MTIEAAIERVKKAAENAWYWSSFSPRERAKRFVSDFEKEINEYAKEIEEIDPKSVDDFVKRYTDKTVEYLNAKSRTASAAVTGPARFNYRKNNSALDREAKIGKELWSYFDYYKNKLEKRIKREAGYHLPDAELERAKQDLIEAKAEHQMNLDGNKILRKGGTDQEVRARLKEIGVPTRKIDFYLRERLPNGKFIFRFGNTNSNARIKRVESRIKELERKTQKAGTEQNKLEFDGGHIIKNYDEDRLQILFDSIPAAEIRTALKKNGYRWSPKQKAWQRKLTRNAVYSLDNLTDLLGIKQPQIDAWDKPVKDQEGERQNKETEKDISEMKPTLTAIVNEDKLQGKPVSSKDYVSWLASLNRLMQMALQMDANEAQKVLQKHEKAVSEAWAKGMDSMDAGRHVATAMDEAAKAEREATAKETRNILQQEADTRDKHAESKGGFDFIHEVGYSGKSVVKTYLPLPESRGLKLNGEPDEDGYRMYWATDKALEKLKQDYPNNQYGMGQQYGGKHLNKSPKLKTTVSKAKQKPKSVSGKTYLTGIEVEWNEGSPQIKGKKYDSAAAFMADLIKIGVPDVGYNKVKFKATYEDGTSIVDRIDLGASGGDYNPLNEGITAYMDRQKSGVMYDSNRDANDVDAGKYTFRFRDDDTLTKPKAKAKPKHNFDIQSTYHPYEKDSNYDAIRANLITPKVYGNRYRIDFIEWRSGNSRVEVTKVENNPFGGVMGKEFETFSDAKRAYKSEVIKAGIDALKQFVDTNLVKMRKQFDQANPAKDPGKLKLLKLRAKAIKLKYKY